MPKLLSLVTVRSQSLKEVGAAIDRYGRLHDKLGVEDQRWLAASVLTEMYGAWERFAERRLVAALNHYPKYFLDENSVKGVSKIPSGLADHLVRKGRRYFDFKSCSDLINIADELVSPQENPFRKITTEYRNHLDVAATLRNYVLHGSDASWDALKKKLREHFSIRSATQPGEFLEAIDRRLHSPKRGEKRLNVFSHVLNSVIQHT